MNKTICSILIALAVPMLLAENESPKELAEKIKKEYLDGKALSDEQVSDMINACPAVLLEEIGRVLGWIGMQIQSKKMILHQLLYNKIHLVPAIAPALKSIDIKMKDGFQQTLLHWITSSLRRGEITSECATQSLQAMQILLDAGVDPNAADCFHETPLSHLAGNKEAHQFIPLLIKYGANPNDAKALTKLCNYNPELVAWFIAQGADVNAVGGGASATPLVEVSLIDTGNNTIITFKELLSHGAQPDDRVMHSLIRTKQWSKLGLLLQRYPEMRQAAKKNCQSVSYKKDSVFNATLENESLLNYAKRECDVVTVPNANASAHYVVSLLLTKLPKGNYFTPSTPEFSKAVECKEQYGSHFTSQAISLCDAIKAIRQSSDRLQAIEGIKKRVTDLESKDGIGNGFGEYTNALFAAIVAAPELIPTLLDHGGNPNSTDGTMRGHLLQKLMASNKDKYKNDPLFDEKKDKDNRLTAMEYALLKGSDPNRNANIWIESLDYKYDGAEPEYYELLAEHGDINGYDPNGNTPLLNVVRSNFCNQKQRYITTLCSNGADANIPDSAGNVPLLHAILEVDKDVVRVLLANGARADIPNLYGETPRAMAQRICKLDSVRPMRKALEKTKKKLIKQDALSEVQSNIFDARVYGLADLISKEQWNNPEWMPTMHEIRNILKKDEYGAFVEFGKIAAKPAWLATKKDGKHQWIEQADGTKKIVAKVVRQALPNDVLVRISEYVGYPYTDYTYNQIYPSSSAAIEPMEE